MADFFETWSLVRGRFDKEVTGLTSEQLNWRLHDATLTLGEMALHVAGVELWFCAQLEGKELEGDDIRLAKCATDGSVNDNPFPYSQDEITPERVEAALAKARGIVEPMITNLTPEIRAVHIKSALGPIIDGTGAFARLAYHPGYHQGQAYVIKSATGFPS